MKRFVETNIWDAEWFQDLPPSAKCLWGFMKAKCDPAGVWDPNWKMASLAVGEKVTVDSLTVFGPKITILPTGILVSDFIHEQYSTLNPDSSFHKTVFAYLKKHNLDATGVPLGCHWGATQSAISGTQRAKEKEKEIVQGKEREGECKGETQKQVETIYEAYPRKVGKPDAFRAIQKALKEITADELLRRTVAYAERASLIGREIQFLPHPATFFNGKEFNDSLEDLLPDRRNGTQRQLIHCSEVKRPENDPNKQLRELLA